MKMLKPLISVVAAALLVQFVAATNHTVGAPNGGWDDMTDLQTWASSQKFVAGDYLVFVYGASHNVFEVSSADYDTCNADNPISASAGGVTVIELTTPGKKYFICGATGHCARGMKIEVDVLTSAAPPPPPPATPSIPPPTPAATPSTPPPEATPSPPTEAPRAPAPHAEPVSAPVSSPSHSPPKHSPVYAPKVSPAPAPSKSHAKSPSKAPARSPSKAPVKSMAPSEAPSTSPSGGFEPAPTPGQTSAATTANAVAGSAVGFAFAVMMLLAL